MTVYSHHKEKKADINCLCFVYTAKRKEKKMRLPFRAPDATQQADLQGHLNWD